MKWKDNSKNRIPFEDLKVGEGFEDSGNLYIKVSDDCAFDVVNDKGSFSSLQQKSLHETAKLFYVKEI